MAVIVKKGNFGKSRSGRDIKTKITISSSRRGKRSSSSSGGSSRALTQQEKEKIFQEAVEKGKRQAIGVATSGTFATGGNRKGVRTVVQNGNILSVRNDGSFERVGLTREAQARRDRIRTGQATASDLFAGVDRTTAKGQQIIAQRLQPFMTKQAREQEALRQERQARGRAMLSRDSPRLEVKKQDFAKSNNVASFQPRITATSTITGVKAKPKTEISKLTPKQVNKLAKSAEKSLKRGEALDELEFSALNLVKSKTKSNADIVKASPNWAKPFMNFQNKAGDYIRTKVAEVGVSALFLPSRFAQVADKAVLGNRIGVTSTLKGDFRRFVTALTKENVRVQPSVQESLKYAFKDPTTYVFALLSARSSVKGKKPIGYMEKEPIPNTKVAKALKNEAIVTKTDLKDRLKVIEFDNAGNIIKVEIFNPKKKKEKQIRVKTKTSKKVKYLEYNDRGQLVKSGFVTDLNPPPKSIVKPKFTDRVKVYEYNANGKLIKTGFAERITGKKDKFVRTKKKQTFSRPVSRKIKVLYYDLNGKLIKSTFGKTITGKKDKLLPNTEKVKIQQSKNTPREKIVEIDEKGRILRSYFADVDKLVKPQITKPKVDNRIKVIEFDEKGNLIKSFFGKKARKDNFTVKPNGLVELKSTNLLPLFKGNKKGQAQFSITRLEKPISITKTLLFKNKKAKFKINYNARVLKALSLSLPAISKARRISLIPQNVSLSELQKLASEIKNLNKIIEISLNRLKKLERTKEGERIISKSLSRSATKFKTSTKQRTISKSRTKKKVKPKEKLPLPKLPKFKQDTPFNTDIKNPKGFDAWIKTKNGWRKANPQPLQRQEAQKLGRYIADNTLSASFTVVGTRNKAIKKAVPFDAPKQMFRLSKDKRKPKGTRVEKRTYRINTAGEKRGLRASALIAKVRKRLTAKKKRQK